jgi:hypothetical protein
MKNTSKNTQSIIEDMKKITILTGEISNVHEKSLLTWPYVVFDHVKNVEIKYDLSKSAYSDLGHNVVEFFVTLAEEGKQNIDNFEKRCQTLKEWTESMLWSGIEVKVHINEPLESGENGLK